MSIPNSFDPLGTQDKEVPFEYGELTYLASQSGQYISIGEIDRGSLRIKLDIQRIWNVPWFVRNGVETEICGSWYDGFRSDIGLAGSGLTKGMWQAAMGGVWKVLTPQTSVYDRVEIDWDAPNSRVGLNGVYTEFPRVTGIYVGPFLLFARHNQDQGYSQYDIIESRVKIYKATIFLHGKKTHDFVPVLRKSDLKPGMYNLVDKKFYVNQGAGDFSYE